MSLDVYLEGESVDVSCCCACCGHEHTRKETPQFFWKNITHNLGRMADAAGIYRELWRPDELGFTKAEQLIEPLQTGLERLIREPEKFKTFNPENGWGDYNGLVVFVEDYLNACRAHPQANIHISR
jgi:hypothetical protein